MLVAGDRLASCGGSGALAWLCASDTQFVPKVCQSKHTCTAHPGCTETSRQQEPSVDFRQKHDPLKGPVPHPVLSEGSLNGLLHTGGAPLRNSPRMQSAQRPRAIPVHPKIPWQEADNRHTAVLCCEHSTGDRAPVSHRAPFCGSQGEWPRSTFYTHERRHFWH